MAFFSSRPHFENRQIVQWMGESIHLSGQTNFDLGGFNSYIYDTYEDFLNGISGTSFTSLPLSAATDPVSGWSNHTVYSPGIVRIIPPRKIFFSGNTNVITGITQEDVTGYIPVAFDSQGTVVWTPFSTITSGSCVPDFYVTTIHPCSSGGTVTIEGNLTVKGVTTSGVTIIETEIVRVEDNNMELNWGGNHTTAIGGGITVLSGQSNSANSSIYTLSDGTWMFEPGLSATTIPYIYDTSVSSSAIIPQLGNNSSKSNFTAILAGTGNTITTNSNYSTILGGQDNTISGNSSVIIGGYNNQLFNTLNSVILGGENITGTTSNTIYTPNITVQSGKKIHGQNETKTTLTFGTLGNEHIGLTLDNDSYVKPYLYLDDTGGQLAVKGGIVVENYMGFTVIGSANTTTTPGINIINNKLSDRKTAALLGNPAIFVGSQDSTFLSGVTNSVILGGVGLTATTDNTVYVPYLNISNAPGGTPLADLKIDSNGNVITGATLTVGGVGDLCTLCNYSFTGDTGTTITITEGIPDVDIKEPTEGTITVECARCCTLWEYKYVDNSVNPRNVVYLITSNFNDIKVAKANASYSSLKYRCVGTESSGIKEGGKNYGVDIKLETIPTLNTEPTPIGGVGDFKPTNTESIEIGKDVFMVDVRDSSGVKVEYSTLVGMSGNSTTITDTSFNVMTYDSTHVKLTTSRDSLISESSFSTMNSTKESTLKGDYVTFASTFNAETVSGVEGTAIIAAKDITATQDYTLYTSGLYVDDVNGLNVNSLTVSTPADSCNLVVTTGGTVGVKTCNPTFDLEVNGTFGATSKSFVIPHPLKEGKKLVHGAIEGPEFGVYTRGRFFDGVIELPDYWVNLVDESTITVQLTGEGFFMSPYVKEIKDNKVFVGNRFPFLKPNGFYTVYGERKDIDKIKLEIDA